MKYEEFGSLWRLLNWRFLLILSISFECVISSIKHKHRHKYGRLMIDCNPVNDSDPTPIKTEPMEVFNEDFKDQLTDLTNEAWLNDALEMHNKLRARHGSRPLLLDYKLCFDAEQWAMELAEMSFAAGSVVLDHSPGYSQGENIGGKFNENRTLLEEIPGSFAVKVWYQEIVNYDWKTNFFNHNTGHFSQMIWGASKRLGCARQIGGDTILQIVCRYTPPGNYLYKNAFKSHVNPPIDSLGKNAIPDYAKL